MLTREASRVNYGRFQGVRREATSLSLNPDPKHCSYLESATPGRRAHLKSRDSEKFATARMYCSREEEVQGADRSEDLTTA